MSSSPAIPIYVLRGHNGPVHSLLFFHENAFLASGDADGWLIVWSISSKRPVGVWKAHEQGVTGIKAWKSDRLLTTPADGAVDDQPKPWLLHAMDMSALNFCAFAIVCGAGHGNDDDWTPASSGEELLIASPNAIDSGGVDVFHLPSERRVLQLHSQKDRKTGMVMSMAMFLRPLSNEQVRLYLMSGYEDGHVMVHYYDDLSTQRSSGSWHKAMDCKAHSQPVLSLDLSPHRDAFFSSSADAVIAKFLLTPAGGGAADGDGAFKTANTKHAGQQGLSVRSDGKIFATAGWDARARAYSCKTLKELAVLKWHKGGCSSTAFATVVDEQQTRQHEATGPDVLALAPPTGTSLEKIKHERSLQAQRTHWLAVGGKDAKISLWDIY
ncbi:hypothetical protein DV737_g4719, partial [Chaetothyriales sp. CBS 132003]